MPERAAEFRHRGIWLLFLVLFAVCPLLFFTDLTRNPYYTQIAILNAVVPACWILWLWQSLRKGELVWTYTALDPALLALLAVSLISWGNSFLQHRAFSSAIYSEGSKAFIFLVVNTYLIYAAAVRAQDARTFAILLRITYAVSAFAAMYGILQYYGIEILWPRALSPYGNRPISTFGNPNFMSSYLVVLLPAMVADFLFSVTGVPRFFLFVAILLDTGALMATLTRSSWVGFIAELAVLAWGISRAPDTWPKIKKPALVLAAAIGLVLLAWPRSATEAYKPAIVARMTEMKAMSEGSYASATQRYLIWSSAWSMVEDHPFLGKGWGCFELFYPFYQGAQLFRESQRWLRTHANNAHNEILEYFSQVGCIGFGIVVWMWLIYFRRGASIARRLPTPWAMLQWGLLGGSAGMLVDNLLNVSAHFAVPAFIFWWFIGTAMVLDPQAVREWRWSLASAGAKALVSLAIIVLIGLIVRSFCMWRGEVNFFEGFKMSKAGADLIGASQALERAYHWHQLEVNNNYELANVQARLGNREKALFFYGRALDANGGYDEINFNRATVESQMGRDADAIAHYKIAIAINPISHDAYNALATLYFKDLKNNADKIEALYQQGVIFFPNDKDMWNNLGYLYTQLEKWEEAYQAYRHALEIDPEWELARKNMAAILRHVPEHRNDPLFNIERELQRIEAALNAQRWAEAKELSERLVQASPRSFRGHFYLGSAEFGLQKNEEALKAFQTAVSLQPNAEGAWQNLGVIYDKLGRSAEAIEAFQKVLALNPQNETARARLGNR